MSFLRAAAYSATVKEDICEELRAVSYESWMTPITNQPQQLAWQYR